MIISIYRKDDNNEMVILKDVVEHDSEMYWIMRVFFHSENIGDTREYIPMLLIKKLYTLALKAVISQNPTILPAPSNDILWSKQENATYNIIRVLKIFFDKFDNDGNVDPDRIFIRFGRQ